jgi:hypothetical protein
MPDRVTHTDPDDSAKFLGTWATDDGHVRQQLLPGGRYVEARGEKESAYTGAYQINGTHIEYQDDSGFSVDGDFIDGVLHHVGMLLYRKDGLNQPRNQGNVMSYSEIEKVNLEAVSDALDAATEDFGKFGEAVFDDDVEWTITGYGLVARTFHGMKDLIDNAEQALFDRWDGTAAVTKKGVWADGDKVFAHLTSAARAVDGLPYANEYLYILTMRNKKVVAGTAWLDLHAYYDIIDRIKLPS